MNYLIRDNLEEIVNLPDIIKTDELHYKSKRRKIIYLLFFKRYT